MVLVSQYPFNSMLEKSVIVNHKVDKLACRPISKPISNRSEQSVDTKCF